MARKPIRRVEDSSRPDDPVLDLPQGAHLKIKSQKLFDPKFGEDGSLWIPSVSLGLKVIDDFDEGEDDDKVFTDKFELKLDPELLNKSMQDHGWDEYKDFRNSNRRDYTDEEIEQILDPSNWIIKNDTKLDNLLICLHGKKWIRGEVDFVPEDLVGAEFIAKVQPRTGKRLGSFLGWDSFSSIRSAKKERTKADSKPYKHSDTQDLDPEDEAQMNEVFDKVS